MKLDGGDKECQQVPASASSTAVNLPTNLAASANQSSNTDSKKVSVSPIHLSNGRPRSGISIVRHSTCGPYNKFIIVCYQSIAHYTQSHVGGESFLVMNVFDDDCYRFVTASEYRTIMLAEQKNLAHNKEQKPEKIKKFL